MSTEGFNEENSLSFTFSHDFHFNKIQEFFNSAKKGIVVPVGL